MSYRLRSSLASILLDGPRRVMGGYINTSIYCPSCNLSVRSLRLLKQIYGKRNFTEFQMSQIKLNAGYF